MTGGRAGTTVPNAPRPLQLYQDASPGVRLHTAVRWWTCPFPAVEAAVPRHGRVLEIGCGHGLLSLFLGLSASDRQVIGVDVDETKVRAARAAASRLRSGEAHVTFRAVGSGWLPQEPTDAVVIADVLYLLTVDQQHRLLKAAAACLAQGGVMVIKEVASTPRWKFRWNQTQETLSTRVLGITASGGGLHFVPPATMSGWLDDAGLETTSRPLDRGYPWPHHLLVGRRAA